MATVDGLQKTPGVFTLTWSIHNFSRCMSTAGEISSSSIPFYFRSTGWFLVLYPKGYYSPGFLSFYMVPMDQTLFQGPAFHYDKLKYVLSVRKCNGLFKDSNEIIVNNHGSGPLESKEFISLNDLYKPDSYLHNDVLTLRCRLWKTDADLSESVYCLARTKIMVHKLSYSWFVNDLADSDGIPKNNFSRTTDILTVSKEIPGIKLHLCTGDNFGDDTIYFAIDKHAHSTAYNRLFAVYQVQLLESSGSIAQSINGEVSFKDSKDIRKFPFLSKRKLLANKEMYLSDGKLTLQCEFSFSGQFIVESFEYRKTDELYLKYANDVKPSLNVVRSGYELWKENMRQFYYGGNLSDLVVLTPCQRYPVHRAILCAQSEVFQGMLSHDMKEKNSGVFEITDFDAETVSRLLLYLYTNTVDDIDYAMAKDLYFAADKYRITPLQRICSNHLMESMDTSNVCDILLVAEQLRDRELKSTARDFIVSHAHEIINSDGWKSLKKNNVDLIIETTERMILNKLPK